MIYLFTDGFADQFGGENNKKFKVSQLRKLIFEASNDPFLLQKEKFNSEFEKWKGNNEQVDDVCLIGVKI